MKKTIIAIWGSQNQGKSSTIKEVVKIILARNPSSKFSPPVIDYSGDVIVTIEIGSIRIGIESQGDPNSRLFSSLKKFSSQNLDIIICATRSHGATVDAVSDLHASHGYDILWVTNIISYQKPQASLNYYSAIQVADLVNDLINGVI